MKGTVYVFDCRRPAKQQLRDYGTCELAELEQYLIDKVAPKLGLPAKERCNEDFLEGCQLFASFMIFVTDAGLPIWWETLAFAGVSGRMPYQSTINSDSDLGKVTAYRNEHIILNKMMADARVGKWHVRLRHASQAADMHRRFGGYVWMGDYKHVMGVRYNSPVWFSGKYSEDEVDEIRENNGFTGGHFTQRPNRQQTAV